MSRCSANIGITFDGVGGDDVDVDEQKHAHNAFVLLHLNMMHPCKYACLPNTNNRWFHYELSLLVVHHFQLFRLYVVSYFSYSLAFCAFAMDEWLFEASSMQGESEIEPLYSALFFLSSLHFNWNVHNNQKSIFSTLYADAFLIEFPLTYIYVYIKEY